MKEVRGTPHQNMTPTHKLVWAGTVVFVLFLFFTMVRGPFSFALFIGTSLLLGLLVSDVLNRGFHSGAPKPAFPHLEGVSDVAAVNSWEVGSLGSSSTSLGEFCMVAALVQRRPEFVLS